MDQHDHESPFSERFRTFRSALHLESPLEFSVVLFVVVCLLGAAGIWLTICWGRSFIPSSTRAKRAADRRTPERFSHLRLILLVLHPV